MTDDAAANQLGTDLAISLMLRMAFELLGDMTDDPDKFRTDITNDLVNLASTVTLPPMPAKAVPKVRGVMITTISSLLSNAPPEARAADAAFAVQ
jgi:hypothetical protein